MSYIFFTTNKKKFLQEQIASLSPAERIALLNEEEKRAIAHTKINAHMALNWFEGLTQKEKMLFLSEASALTHEPLTLDKINQKMIKPLEFLIEGKQYYEFVSTADMPEGRFVHFNHFRQELTQGMDAETINKYFDEMITANNGQDNSRVGALIYMMRDTINNCTPMEVLYNLAALVYFDKDEDLSCFDHDYNEKKKQLFKAHPNQTFFLARLLEKGLKNVGKGSPEDTLKYLREGAVKLKAYRQILFGPSGSRTENRSNGT